MKFSAVATLTHGSPVRFSARAQHVLEKKTKQSVISRHAALLTSHLTNLLQVEINEAYHAGSCCCPLRNQV